MRASSSTSASTVRTCCGPRLATDACSVRTARSSVRRCRCSAGARAVAPEGQEPRGSTSPAAERLRARHQPADVSLGRIDAFGLLRQPGRPRVDQRSYVESGATSLTSDVRAAGFLRITADWPKYAICAATHIAYLGAVLPKLREQPATRRGAPPPRSPGDDEAPGPVPT